MKKEQAVTECKRLLEKYGSALHYSKIPDKQLQLLIKRLDREDVKSSFAFAVNKVLTNIGIEYWEFKKARALVPESTWDFYDMMEYNGLAEQVILDRAIKDFKDQWKQLPVFRKETHVKKRSTK